MNQENFSSTEETVSLSKRNSGKSRHCPTKTQVLVKSRRSLFSKKKKLRHSSKPTDSTSTLIEHPGISQSLNNHNLKISLKSIYETDPVAKLKEIFKSKPTFTPKRRTKKVPKNFSCDINPRRRGKVDSIFQTNEAEFIINELRTIKSPEVWNQVVQNFKKKPSVLMDLIPLEPPTKICRTPNSRCSPNNFAAFMRNPATPLRSARRNMSSTLNKTSALCYKSPKITRPGSVSPVEVVTFLQESENEKLTEDWSKSLLYQKISNLDGIELAMTEQEMKVLSRKPPRDPEEIVKAMNKGLNLLRILLMELLGTKEDMQRFEERFRGNTRYHVRALMERCLNLMKVRNTTADILQKVHKREMILKNLRVTKNKIKDKVLKVFEMNKEIRADIENWASDDSVPFSSFTFKGKNYLAKISEDLIVLQGYLDRISAKGMNK